jgi:hypothetical protein
MEIYTKLQRILTVGELGTKSSKKCLSASCEKSDTD